MYLILDRNRATNIPFDIGSQGIRASLATGISINLSAVSRLLPTSLVEYNSTVLHERERNIPQGSTILLLGILGSPDIAVKTHSHVP